jgi:hypothetical protein
MECLDCGSPDVEYVRNKKLPRVVIRCHKCNYGRFPTHSEANAYCIWREENDLTEDWVVYDTKLQN